MKFEKALFWFRRDLRDEDNAGFTQALLAAKAVHTVFVFDTTILNELKNPFDRRVDFIWQSLVELEKALAQKGGGLQFEVGDPIKVIPALAKRLKVEAVFTNRDYEPQAVARDERVQGQLAKSEIAFYPFKDQVIFDPEEVLNQSGKPFQVFTPYRNAWLRKLKDQPILFYEAKGRHGVLKKPSPKEVMPSLERLGFKKTDLTELGIQPGMSGAKATLEAFLPHLSRYHLDRDFPARQGTSHLSIHLRFGTISIRALVAEALSQAGQGAEVWLNELIWREFYFALIAHFPSAATESFKPEYRSLKFENNANLFKAWTEGKTGFPIVDAGMRQLNQTGFMHNRLRMIVASFLVKDLHIDWRWGEAYFAEKLNDFDLSANNGGWQWCASTGCDAQPYFRIFNPTLQSKRFDPTGEMIRQYVPELQSVPDRYIHEPVRMPLSLQESVGCRIGKDYPTPVVDHAKARDKTLKLFA